MSFSFNSNSNREFFKNTKKSRIFLRIGFVKLLIFRYWVIQRNTEVKSKFMVIMESSRKKKYLPQISIKRSQSSPQIPANLLRFAIFDGSIRGLSQLRMLIYISIYFLGISFLFFYQNLCFYYFHFFSWSTEFPQQNIN